MVRQALPPCHQTVKAAGRIVGAHLVVSLCVGCLVRSAARVLKPQKMMMQPLSLTRHMDLKCTPRQLYKGLAWWVGPSSATTGSSEGRGWDIIAHLLSSVSCFLICSHVDADSRPAEEIFNDGGMSFARSAHEGRPSTRACTPHTHALHRTVPNRN